MTVPSDGFGAFFLAVHGHPPFRWQEELATEVITTGAWPEALDVPTGMGKTAALDIAVFNLALQANRPVEQRTAPTRTFFVVDRRVIVDQTHRRGQLLARALLTPASEVVAEVATALSSLSGGRPLHAVRMRGGTTWSWRWLSSARQPAIVTGTVDQLGSRLLFRGYGVGDRIKPVDAALCGNDSLLFLDEAHLSTAFLKTIDAVRAYEELAPNGPLPARRPRTVLLSATLRTRAGKQVQTFRCDPTKEVSPVARRRLDAVKSTRLIDVRAKGDLAATLEQLARDALTRALRVAVVCNTVLLARDVFDRLADLGETADRALLIGRCRDAEKERNTKTWVERIAAGSERTGSPVVVVATQTIEVGADLDVDVLITEACPLDALTQRLGRLNRFGDQPEADAVVVFDAARHGLAERTPVYGEAVAATWGWLVEQAGVPPVTTPAKVLQSWRTAPQLDLGLSGALQLISEQDRTTLTGRDVLTPSVLSPVLDLWAQTSPMPEPDQDVAPYLHGIQRTRPEVSFVWRAGLHTAEDWETELRLFPPLAYEQVTVGLVDALRFLNGAAPAGSQSDQEGAPDDEDDDPFGERPSLALAGRIVQPDGTNEPVSHARVRPGATVVLDSGVGGHDEWGWTGIRSDRIVPDVADLSPTGAVRVRLRATLWGALLTDVPDKALDEAAWPDDDGDLKVSVLLADLHKMALASRGWVAEELVQVLSVLRLSANPRVIRLKDDRHLALAIAARRQISEDVDFGAATFGTGGDTGGTTSENGASSSVSVRSITLDQHLRDVGRVGEAEARGLGLDPALVRAVQFAGLAHDLGKADSRFQQMLHGGDPYRAELAPEPLAKSPTAQDSRAGRRAARLASGWPSGMRHESISAALVRGLQERHPELLDGVDGELVLHLVASHHGYARPLLPPVHDDSPDTVSASVPAWADDVVAAECRSNDGVVDWDHPGRYSRLCARYGRWGLALLESVVRLADMSESERYDGEAAAL